MAGGESERLTDSKQKIEAFRWSPGGRRIALLMTEPKPDAQQAREKDKEDARIADKDDRFTRVWTLDLASRALTQLTTARYRIGQIEFAPDGSRLIAAAAAQPDEDRFTEAIFAIDLRGGRFTPVAAPRGPAPSRSTG